MIETRQLKITQQQLQHTLGMEANAELLWVLTCSSSRVSFVHLPT